MESRLKFYKTFLITTIFLYPALAVLNYYLLTKYIPQWKTDGIVLLLISSLIFFSISSLFVVFLFRKYPHQSISNTVEVLMIIFIIVTLLLSIIDLALVYLFSEISIDLQKKGDNPISKAILLASGLFVVAIACAVFVSINSIRLLKTIQRNRLNLAQQIKNIGANDE